MEGRKREIKFSLIVGTLNRRDALEKCLASLFAQTYANYEIIIVDQSDGDETGTMIAESFRDARVRYYSARYKSLSRARNEAIGHMSGDYACLIDDDAEYAHDYLETAVRAIRARGGRTILSGYICDIVSKDAFIDYGIARNLETLSGNRVMRICPAAALVFPKEVFDACGNFDEQFGAGGIYHSSEETDLLLRARYQGFQVVFLEDLKVYHPVYEKTENVSKEYRYAFGGGALAMKHFVAYRRPFALLFMTVRRILAQVIRIVMYFNRPERAVHLARLRGCAAGMAHYRKRTGELVK